MDEILRIQSPDVMLEKIQTKLREICEFVNGIQIKTKDDLDPFIITKVRFCLQSVFSSWRFTWEFRISMQLSICNLANHQRPIEIRRREEFGSCSSGFAMEQHIEKR